MAKYTDIEDTSTSCHGDFDDCTNDNSICGECGNCKNHCNGPYGACGSPKYENELEQEIIFDM